MGSEEVRCCKTVHRHGEWRGSPCEKKPTVEREGKMYCSTHDPVRVAARDVARREAWNRERAAAQIHSEIRIAREQIADFVEDYDGDLPRRLHDIRTQIRALREQLRSAEGTTPPNHSPPTQEHR